MLLDERGSHEARSSKVSFSSPVFSFYSSIYSFSEHMCAGLREKEKGMNIEEVLGEEKDGLSLST